MVAELARIAFADIRELFDERGRILPFADLSPSIQSAVAEYTVRKGRNGTHEVRLKLHSRLPALAALGRHLGMFGRRSNRATLAP